MHRALRLARRGEYTCSPNPAVGCVIVRDGRVLGEGYHHRAGCPHAEIMALEDAASRGNEVRGATVYVTLEPCSHQGRTPPCAARLIEEGVAQVVVANKDPNPQVSGRGLTMLRQAGIRVFEGVLQNKAAHLNRAFFKAISTGLPYVTVKVAMSLDAASSLRDGQSKWLTSPRSRRRVQRLRAGCQAVITGSGTVLADNPRLNVRYEELPGTVRDFVAAQELPQPLRVVLDGRGRLAGQDLNVFSGQPTLWCTAKAQHSAPSAAENLCLPRTAEGALDLRALLGELGRRQIRHVLVEAGPTLTAAFLSSGLVDELLVFTGPLILGGESRPAFALKAPPSLDKAQHFSLYRAKKLGDDVLLQYLVPPLQGETCLPA